MTTAVFLLVATLAAYPPCTPQRTDNCTTAYQQAPATQWGTTYIPCPKGQYCPAYDIPRRHPKKLP